MLLVKTIVGTSRIHGVGVFAEEPIARGTIVWRYEPLFDRSLAESDLVDVPPAFRDYLNRYAYRSKDLDGQLILSCDNARFLNHSSSPNTDELAFCSVANEPISIGQEITCDYGAFCTDGLGFEEKSPQIPAWEDVSGLPHSNLYTRIKTSSSGVGVFAIRDIPQGTRLFVGDRGETVLIPKGIVAEISDPEIRRIYEDFCPMLDQNFVAPADFNRLTMGWYLNHSERPNVSAIDGLEFVAARLILAGEELTANYTNYSEDAAVRMQNWAETQ